MKRPSIDELVAALAKAEDPPAVLEAAGRLVAAGAADRVGVLDTEIDLAIGELEDSAYAALESLDDIEAVRGAFGVRDAVELRRIGAEAILGHPPELSMDEESSLVAFEEALRPHLWRLTALNEWRSLEVAWMTPEHRSRFWWWSEAGEVDPRGALHLDAVAELIARFPEADVELRKLAATELLLRQPSAEVLDLGAWLRARSEPLAMAASTGVRERVLFEHPAFTLSLLAPDALLIDLLERRGPEPPRIRIGGIVVEGEPVPEALERYRFDLKRLFAHAGPAELVLSLASGEVRTALPPDPVG